MAITGTIARPAPSLPERARTCWRCGIEFVPNTRARSDAPCVDCRPQVEKPAGGWHKKGDPDG